jgi:hypothetical protein
MRGVNWEYHRTVGDGRVGSYAEPKAAGLSKAGKGERERAACCGDVGTREERVRMDEIELAGFV